MGRPEGGYGEGIVGVTTVTGYYKSKPAVDALIGWGRAQGAAKKDPLAVLEAAGDIGTIVHDMITAYIEGAGVIEVMDLAMENTAVLRAYSAFQKWKGDKEIDWLFWEKPLVSQIGLGGTPDAIGRYQNKRTVFDWKTSSGIYPDQHTPQVAAYAFLWEEHHPDEPIEQAIIVQLNKATGKWTSLTLDETDLASGWEDFADSFRKFKRRLVFEAQKGRITK